MTGRDRPLRMFVALYLPDDVRTFLAGLQYRLARLGVKGAFPRPENLHLTLKFIDAMLPQRVDDVLYCMEKAVFHIPAFTLSASGIGVFPSIKHPRVIWSGIRGQTDVLGLLAAHLDRQLFDSLNIPIENKRFSPHLTLVRVKGAVDPRTMVQWIQEFENIHSPEFRVSDIRLFKSDLNPSGAIHYQLGSIPLDFSMGTASH